MTDKSRSDFFYYLVFSTCIASALALWYVSGKASVPTGDLIDSDGYMHLVRASELYETGRWYDPVVERSNAPYGDRLHWTRPFDLLLLAGAIPGSWLTSFPSALFWWGVMVGPVILIAVLLSLRWAARPLLGNDGASISGLLLAVQIGVLAYLQAGRPDHHGLLLLLFVLSLGLAMRLVGHPFHPGLCVAAGAMGALSMWVSVESSVMVGVIVAVMVSLWIRDGGDAMTKAFCYSASLLAFTCLAIVFERPWSDITTVEFDRLSIGHVIVFGLLALSLLALALAAASVSILQRRRGRLAVALAVGAVLILLTAAILPTFYGAARMYANPEMARIFACVRELQPLASDQFFRTSGTALAGYGVLFLGLLLGRRIGLADPRWLLVSVVAGTFTGLAFYQLRWAMYGEAVLLLPAAALITDLRARASRSQRGLCRLLINTGIMAAFLLLPACGLLVVRFTEVAGSSAIHPQPSIRAMGRYLTTDTQWRGRKLRILTEINYGAEILYRTPHEVLATIYHRNWQAVSDARAIMAAPTDDEALARIRAREIDVILLTPEASEQSLFAAPGKPSSFYRRLCNGELPPWCRPIELPDDLSAFRLFAVAAD